MVWSDFYFKNPSPTKKKGVKTVPSPTTARLGGMLHSVAAFVGLTAEATWYINVCLAIIIKCGFISSYIFFSSNKRKQENIENMKHLLKVAENAIEKLSILRY